MTTTTLTQLSIAKVNAGAAGDIFLLEDGTYDHVSREAISKGGVTLKAKNQGKAIIKGAPIDVSGPQVTFDGFELQYSSTEQTVVSLRGTGYKFTNNKCRFGNPTANRNDWIVVKGADGGLIQGNDIGNKTGMGNMLLIGPGTIVKNTKVLDNKIHDFTGGVGNGAEAIRFGASQVAREEFAVEFANNEVYNINTSDDELITVKSSKNNIHDNVFRNCRASPCFRHGRFNKFINNKLEGVGIRIYGKGHEITNNNFKRDPNSQLLQIVIGNGEFAEEEQNTTASYTQVRDLIFANNYIDMENSTTNIILCWGYGSHSLKPIGNKVTGNKILAANGTLANTKDGASWNNNTISDNILWATGSAKYGDMPTGGYMKKDPNVTPTPVPPTPTPEPIPTPPAATIEERIASLEARVTKLESAP